MVKIKITWDRAALLAILLVSGFLGFFSAWNEGYGNPYYAAAVKSMLTSWHNFFFVSFDPGGYVSIDKPPVALWLQTLSAWIFGFKGWSLILPQTLAAVISVALVYYLVKLVIKDTYQRLTRVMDSTGECYEIILVNDGSKDRTMEMARAICNRDINIKLLSFSRNFGHQVAITAGMLWVFKSASRVRDR